MSILKRIPSTGIIALTLVFVFCSHAVAQQTSEKTMEEQMMEVIRASGLEGDDAAQVEALMKGAIATENAQKEADANDEVSAFNRKYGKGTNVQLGLGSQLHQLVVTKCQWLDPANGTYLFSARKRPNEPKLELHINGSSSTAGTIVGLSADPIEFFANEARFDEKTLTWSGTIDMGNGNPEAVTVHARCD